MSDIKINYDTEGFLIDTQQWSETLGKVLAKKEGIESLTLKHWEIIAQLRLHYLQYNAPPSTYEICKDLGQKKLCLIDAFPTMLVAWKIAGLPNPGEEAKAYMENYSDNSTL